MIRILAFLEADNVTGPTKNLLEFHRQLPRLSTPVELQIATFQRNPAPNAFTRAIEQADIPLHVIPENAALDRSVFPHIHALADRLQPSIFQTHSIKSHFLLRWTGLWQQTPWIAFHHGYTLTNRRLLIYNQLDRWSLPRAKHVVTVSEAFANDLRRRGVANSRITVLHNAIDPDWGQRANDTALRAETRAKLGIRDNESVLLIVGRLSLEKSHVLLVEAIAQLRTLLPGRSVRLLIAGDGPERPNIEAAARAHGIGPQIIFAGQVSDVLPMYAAADLAVLASKSEGSPNALLEALAASLPVVATSVGGVPEIVTEGETAWLVPPSDAPAMATALADALANPDKAMAMAQRGRQLILDRFTPLGRAQKLLALYAAHSAVTAGART
ncbi:MAG: glycosyltransferase family 4 protein [Acidobacteriota bacterium]